ncbi:hypothetical protein UlMin_010159 [Ulmus minor]
MADQLQETNLQNQNPSEEHQDSIIPLDNFSNLQLSCCKSSSAMNDHHHHPLTCVNCGYIGSSSGSLKRPFSSSSSDQQPKPKKLYSEQSDDAAPPGFTKISFSLGPDSSSQNQIQPSRHDFRRCLSEPTHVPSAPAKSPPESFPGSGSGISSNGSQSPERLKTSPNPVTPCSGKDSGSISGRPPRDTPLRRCHSDLTASPATNFSRSSSSGDLLLEKTNDPKKLKQVWNCVKELSSWMEEVMGEDQGQEAQVLEEDGDAQDHNQVATNKEVSDVEFEEVVKVEKVGEGLAINFKCHCGKLFQFLIAEGYCYYKLM